MPRKDPQLRREYHRKYMANKLATDPEFKARHLARVRRNSTRVRKEVDDLIGKFKSGGCILCTESDYCALAAHHLDPQVKDFNIGDARRLRLAVEKVEAELSKCVCLCHNCHAKVHAGKIEVHAGVT